MNQSYYKVQGYSPELIKVNKRFDFAMFSNPELKM
jgi:hypothetical protein